MLLYSLPNRDLELWILDRAGSAPALPAGPTVYALVSYEPPARGVYIGASRQLATRLGVHISRARSH